MGEEVTSDEVHQQLKDYLTQSPDNAHELFIAYLNNLRRSRTYILIKLRKIKPNSEQERQMLTATREEFKPIRHEAGEFMRIEVSLSARSARDSEVVEARQEILYTFQRVASQSAPEIMHYTQEDNIDRISP